MLKEDHRSIYVLDAILSASSRSMPETRFTPRKAVDIFKELEDAHKRVSFSFPRNRGTETIYLHSMKFARDLSSVTLLIAKSDQVAANPVFSNPEKRTRRIAEKAQGEGIDHSAHLIWMLQPRAPGDNYLAFLECVPGLGITIIKSFINNLFGLCAKINPKNYEIPHPENSVDEKGKPKHIKLINRVTLDGHLSDSFITDLNNGKLNELSVYTEYSPNTRWDDKGYTRPVRQSIKLQVDGGGGLRNFPIVKAAFSAKKANPFENGRISFETEDGQKHTVSLRTDTLTQIQGKELQYVKRLQVDDFRLPLPTSHDQINSELVTKVLNKARNIS